MIPGISQMESITDKWELAIQCIDVMQYVINATRTKTLHFKRHGIIDDTLWKMKAIYNPIKRFAVQFIPGYDPSRGHETTPFSMNYS